MSIVLFIYVFSLYVLFTPGVILNKRNNHGLINAILFSIVWYITFDFVERNQECMTQGDEVDVNGLNDLVNSLNEEVREKIINVRVNNEYVVSPASDNSGIIELCEQKIQEIAEYKQKIEDLTAKLASYAGTRELIASLKNTVSQLEEKKAELMKQLDLANEIINNQKTTIDGKDDQLEVLDQSIQQKDGTIQTQTETIDSKNVNIVDLNGTINGNNNTIRGQTNTINGKNNTINSLNGTINGQTNTINSLSGTINGKNNTINSLNSQINQKNNTINSLNSQINQKNNQINRCYSWQPCPPTYCPPPNCPSPPTWGGGCTIM